LKSGHNLKFFGCKSQVFVDNNASKASDQKPLSWMALSTKVNPFSLDRKIVIFLRCEFNLTMGYSSAPQNWKGNASCHVNRLGAQDCQLILHGAILNYLGSDSLHILSRLLHPKKVYHSGGLNDCREDQLNEFYWGLTMFLIYRNLVKPGTVLVWYYRLMNKREGELTDEERKQRYKHRCIMAKQVYEKSRVNILWKQWNDSVLLRPDDVKLLVRSIVFKTQVSWNRLKMVEEAGSGIEDLDVKTWFFLVEKCPFYLVSRAWEQLKAVEAASSGIEDLDVETRFFLEKPLLSSLLCME
jgi:hypothetical protein